MIISDLNYLETAQSDVQGAWGFYTFFKNEKIKFDLYSDVDLDDNAAAVNGTSEAYGFDTFTQVDFKTKTTPFSSFSGVYSVAATD